MHNREVKDYLFYKTELKFLGIIFCQIYLLCNAKRVVTKLNHVQVGMLDHYRIFPCRYFAVFLIIFLRIFKIFNNHSVQTESTTFYY
jgi:hypothetical protein